MKTLLTFIACAVIASCPFFNSCEQTQLTIPEYEIQPMPKEKNIKPIEQIDIFVDPNLHIYTLTDFQRLIDEHKTKQRISNEIISNALKLGWDKDSETILQARKQWLQSETAIKIYSQAKEVKAAQIEEAKWNTRKLEYPVATEIWLYMKNLGWTDEVCAGIMGNLMAEVGGGTLAIQYWLYDPTGQYYGICQWYYEYCPAVQGTDLFTQLEYLKSTIKYNIDLFGYIYADNFNYEKFLALTNEKEIALAFAKTYERCSQEHYEIRAINATLAYEYFTK